LADIAVACEIALFALERHEHKKLARFECEPIFNTVANECKRAHRHLEALYAEPAFLPDVTPYFNEMTMKKAFG